MSRTSVYYISIAWSDSTELAWLQQSLGPNFFHLHAQIFLAFPFRELLISVEAGGPRPLAFPCMHSGQRSVRCGMGGQDDGVGHRPAAVWDVNARVAVIFLVMSSEGATRRDIRNRKGMSKSGDIFVPVLTQSPAANAVLLERCVVLPALRALPGILMVKQDTKSHVCLRFNVQVY